MIRGMILFFSAIAVAGLSFAAIRSPADLLNLIVPRSGYTVHRDIAYGNDPRNRLDVYEPAALLDRAPVILFFYGGGWTGGSKDHYLALGQAFASKGFVVVVADYRVYPSALFPDFVRDGAMAFGFVHAAINTFHGDPNRIFLSGHSSGAYIAVLLASDQRYIREIDADPSWIRGVIGIAGPYDFLPLKDPVLKTIFGADLPATQPINFIDGKKPPMFLAAGDADRTVSPRNTERLTAKLEAAGSPVEKSIYPGVGHIGILLSLTPVFRYKASLLDDIVAFIRTH